MLEESPDEVGEWRTWAAGVVLRDAVDRFGGILLLTKKNSFLVGNLLPLKLYVSYTRNNPLGRVLVPSPGLWFWSFHSVRRVEHGPPS